MSGKVVLILVLGSCGVIRSVVKFVIIIAVSGRVPGWTRGVLVCAAASSGVLVVWGPLSSSAIPIARGVAVTVFDRAVATRTSFPSSILVTVAILCPIASLATVPIPVIVTISVLFPVVATVFILLCICVVFGTVIVIADVTLVAVGAAVFFFSLAGSGVRISVGLSVLVPAATAVTPPVPVEASIATRVPLVVAGWVLTRKGR